MFLIQYNLLTESTFNDTIEKVDFVDSEERMKERIFALLQRIERSFMLSIAVLPVTRSVFGLAIAFANETMITSYNL